MSWSNLLWKFFRGFFIQFWAFWHIMGLKRTFLSKVISIWSLKKNSIKTHFAITNCGTRHVNSVSPSPLVSPSGAVTCTTRQPSKNKPPPKKVSKQLFIRNKFLKGAWFDQFTDKLRGFWNILSFWTCSKMLTTQKIRDQYSYSYLYSILPVVWSKVTYRSLFHSLTS